MASYSPLGEQYSLFNCIVNSRMICEPLTIHLYHINERLIVLVTETCIETYKGLHQDCFAMGPNWLGPWYNDPFHGPKSCLQLSPSRIVF